MNDYENFLIDALDRVSTWELPDEYLADAVFAQARLMSGFLPEEAVVQCDSYDLPA